MLSRYLAAMTLALSLSTAAAFAQTAAAPSSATAPTSATVAVDQRSACKSDMDKLCPGVERGDARRTCIETNKGKFSAACISARDADQDRRQAFRAACAGDVAKHCATVEKGQGRATIECIRVNVDKVTPDCKTQLSQLPERAGGENPVAK